MSALLLVFALSAQLFLTLPQHIRTSHSFRTESVGIVLVPRPVFRQSVFRRSVELS